MDKWRRRVAVFPIVIKRRDDKIVTKYTDQTARWLFDAANPVSFPNYFRDVSAGFIDLLPTVHELQLVDDDTFFALVSGVAREGAVRSCLQLVKQNGLDTKTFDTAVFMVYGTGVDAGSIDIHDGSITECVILDELASYTFMTHELGHGLEFQHPFRHSWVSTTYPSGEYGNAYCLMSGETFGGSRVTKPLAYEPAAGIRKDSTFWLRSGPGLSPSNVWRSTTAFVRPDNASFAAPSNPHPFVQVLPAETSETRVSISRPSRPGVSVVAVPDETNTGYITFEYRPAIGWDSQLGSDPADAFSQPGVLIQRIRDIPALPHYGGGFPKAARLVYEALIARNATDYDWDNGHIGVQVQSMSDDVADVIVGRSIGNVRAVRVRQRSSTRSVVSRSPSGLFHNYFGGSQCEVRSAELDRVKFGHSFQFDFTTVGMSNPRFSYAVAGTDLTASTQVVDAQIEQRVPVDALSTRPQTHLVRFNCNASSGRLEVTVDESRGHFGFSVVVTADDASGAPVSLSLDLDVIGEALQFPEGIGDEQQTCLAAMRSVGEDKIAAKVLRPGEEVFKRTDIDWKSLDLTQKAAALSDLSRPNLDPDLRIAVKDLSKAKRVKPIR